MSLGEKCRWHFTQRPCSKNLHKTTVFLTSLPRTILLSSEHCASTETHPAHSVAPVSLTKTQSNPHVHAQRRFSTFAKLGKKCIFHNWQWGLRWFLPHWLSVNMSTQRGFWKTGLFSVWGRQIPPVRAVRSHSHPICHRTRHQDVTSRWFLNKVKARSQQWYYSYQLKLHGNKKVLRKKERWTIRAGAQRCG